MVDQNPPPRVWLKALALNSLLFAAILAFYFVPGLGQALLAAQFLFLGIPFLLLFILICGIQQLIVPRPPASGRRWTLLSVGFALLGFGVVLLLVRLLALALPGAADASGSAAQSVLTMSLCAAAFGATVGFGQWLAIAHRTRLHAWWVGISAVGYLIAGLLLLRALPLLAF